MRFQIFKIAFAKACCNLHSHLDKMLGRDGLSPCTTEQNGLIKVSNIDHLWAQEHACLSAIESVDSFYRYGLIGELLVDGTPVCNLPTTTDAGEHIFEFDWCSKSQHRLRLALEVVWRLLEAPNRRCAPLFHITTKSYLAAPTIGTLPDGRILRAQRAPLHGTLKKIF